MRQFNKVIAKEPRPSREIRYIMQACLNSVAILCNLDVFLLPIRLRESAHFFSLDSKHGRKILVSNFNSGMFLSLNLKLRFQRVAAYPVKLPRVVAQSLFHETRWRQIFARSHLLHIDFIQSQQEIF